MPPDGVTGAGIVGEVCPISPASRLLYLLTPSQCAAQPPRNYVVKGLISRGDHCCIIGLPGSGKSILAPFIGYCVAQGENIFGRRTRKSPVLYLAAEDGTGMAMRVRALFERLGDAPNFHLQPMPVDFLAASSPHIIEVEKLIRLVQPGLVILDTVARAFPGLTENDPEGMGKVVKVVRDFSAICGSAFLSLHHPPKAGEATPRGHSVFNGDLDVSIYLSGEKSEPRTVNMGKNRNGPSDLTFTFGLSVHTFGADDDGDPITAPVAEALTLDAKASHATAKEGRLKDKPAVLLRELRNLLERDAELVCPGPDFPSLRAVKRAALRQRLIERGWFPENVLCTALDKPAELARPGYAVENNALTPLKRNGFIGCTRDWIWLL
jgi:hypothetical protein